MGGRIDDPLVRQGLTDQDQQWVVGHLPPLVKKKELFFYFFIVLSWIVLIIILL